MAASKAATGASSRAASQASAQTGSQAGSPTGSQAELQGSVGSGAPADLPVDLIELLFFAYRDFTGDPDAVLAEYGFGRAHHRVLHFVNRNPGLRVSDLLSILRITKQSLARVLKQLVEEDFIIQQPGPQDRRERLLYSTERGRALADRLTDLQARRICQALAAMPEDARDTVRAFLFHMIDADQRAGVAALIDQRKG